MYRFSQRLVAAFLAGSVVLPACVGNVQGAPDAHTDAAMRGDGFLRDGTPVGDSSRGDVSTPDAADVIASDSTDVPASQVCDGSASGNSSVWTCAADHQSRQRCVNGSIETEACPGCVTQPSGMDDTCTGACAASASGPSSVWTCTGDHASRQRCVGDNVETESCANGCLSRPLGVDDTCASGCANSASGTDIVWTCTSDHTARQRCAMSNTETEACANGCVTEPPGVDDICASGCAGSASGADVVWTCIADHTARQRCVSNNIETDPCPLGCVTQPLGVDDVCATGCAGSASGNDVVWTCTSDHRARQRCVSGAVQTDACANGCVTQPPGVDDSCAPPAGFVSCAYPQWWNYGFSWSPGYYQINVPPYVWDNDLAAASWTPVQLRHPSTLVRESVELWGWWPQFRDEVTGVRFSLVHLHPQQRLTTQVGHTYPAGTLVGYSGGDTRDTGYLVQVPGCTSGPCVFSTGAHLCVETDVSIFTAFPDGNEPCR